MRKSKNRIIRFQFFAKYLPHNGQKTDIKAVNILRK